MVEAMSEKKRWYREFWVWVLIALPASAVVGGMITLYLAVSSSDGLVVDDYYERGKAINLELGRDQTAANRHLQALVRIDALKGRVTVGLESSEHLHPGHLSLLLLHPTRAGQDQVILGREAQQQRYGSIG